MRILLLSHVPSYASGSGIYCRRLADAFVDAGHAVALMAPQSGRALDTGLSVFVPVGTPKSPARWTLPFPFPTFSGHRDSDLRYTEMTATQLDTYLETWSKAVSDVIADFNPDIVHVNHAFLLAYCVSLVAESPYIIVSHGSELVRDLPEHFLRYQVVAVEKSARIIAVSARIGALLVDRLRVPEQRITTITPGYDPEVFRPKQVNRTRLLAEFGLMGTQPCVAYVGRLVKYKRVGDLLVALSLLPADERPDVLIMGDGEAKTQLIRLASELGLRGVCWQPHVDEPVRIADVLNAVDLLVLPSEEDPYPMAAIEALACGTPVLTSNRCGVIDIVSNVAGEVFPVGDRRSMADAIARAIREDWKKTRGARGPGQVQPKSWRAIANQVMDVYRTAVC